MTDPELERQYFARGKDVLGKSAGGILVRYLKASGGAKSLDGMSLARAAVEMAATKENPREWFAGALKAVEPSRPGDGRIAYAAEWNRKVAQTLAKRHAAKVPTKAEKQAVANRAAAYLAQKSVDNSPSPQFVTGQPTPHGRRVAADLEMRHRCRTLAGQAEALAAREDPAQDPTP